MSEHAAESDAPLGPWFRRTPESLPALAEETEALRNAENDARPTHLLNEHGTTDCPVERVRAFADDGECSACGGRVIPPAETAAAREGEGR